MNDLDERLAEWGRSRRESAPLISPPEFAASRRTWPQILVVAAAAVVVAAVALVVALVPHTAAPPAGPTSALTSAPPRDYPVGPNQREVAYGGVAVVVPRSWPKNFESCFTSSSTVDTRVPLPMSCPAMTPALNQRHVRVARGCGRRCSFVTFVGPGFDSYLQTAADRASVDHNRIDGVEARRLTRYPSDGDLKIVIDVRDVTVSIESPYSRLANAIASSVHIVPVTPLRPGGISGILRLVGGPPPGMALPVRGTVKVYRKGSSLDGPPAAQAVTDSQGQFSIRIAPGDYVVNGSFGTLPTCPGQHDLHVVAGGYANTHVDCHIK